MKIKKKRVSALVLAAMLVSSAGTAVNAAETYTWKYQNKTWYYSTATGAHATGWVLSNNYWYYLDSNGAMKTGWILDNNKWYFLDRKSGAMKTGWLKDNNTWYYLDYSGVMTTGWVSSGGKWYFLDASGSMKTGWVLDKNTWYYLDSSGAMKTGWLLYKNNWYYLDASGVMKTGWINVNNVKYYLLPGGEMVTGQKIIDGKPYLFASSGALINDNITGWVKDQNIWYYYNADGTLATGWLDLNGKHYYLNETGQMQAGWSLIDNSWYYFNQNGEMQTDWLWWGNNWYYLDAEGKMVTGEQVINGKKYQFFNNGILNTGPITTTTSYNLTVQEMVNTQMMIKNPVPQTDLYSKKNGYVNKMDILLDLNNPTSGTILPNSVNVLEGPVTGAHIYGALSKYYKDAAGVDQERKVTIVNATGDWFEIQYPYTWRNAKPEDLQYYANPKNFAPNSPEYFQFLVLSGNAGTNSTELNEKVLKGMGTLAGQADAFIRAAKDFNINEIYLINHAFLETGKGKSNLAQGIVVNGVKVYNMYGVNAFDSCPDTCGAQFAYEQGWTDPAKAIYGGAKYIAEKYINNRSRAQNTLYEMRWDPAAGTTPSNHHQYASDIGWAVKQARYISEIYNKLNARTNYYFELPVLKE